MTVGDLKRFLSGLPQALDGVQVDMMPVVVEVPFDAGWSTSAGVVSKITVPVKEDDAFYSPTGTVDPYLKLEAEEGCG